MIWQNLEETYPFKIYIGEKWGKHDGGRFINNFQVKKKNTALITLREKSLKNFEPYFREINLEKP